MITLRELLLQRLGVFVLYQWAVRVQSGLRSYVISTPGCDCGLCAVYDFPGKPMYETGSAGVWDRRSLCEGGRDGFDKLHLFFFFIFSFSLQIASF